VAGNYKCTVNKFEITEKKPHGKVMVQITGGSGTLPVPSNQTFELDEDSQESFAGMAEVCAAAAAATAGPKNTVNIEVKSGGEHEIDVLTYPA
jgi:hypothetical protein